jgi:hypothetical protein
LTKRYIARITRSRNEVYTEIRKELVEIQGEGRYVKYRQGKNRHRYERTTYRRMKKRGEGFA